MFQYRAHGLSVSSEFALPLPPQRGEVDNSDLVLRAGGDRSVPSDVAPGTLLAALDDDQETNFFSLGRDGDRVTLRYPGMCEFVGDDLLRQVDVYLHPNTDPGVVSVLAAGALLAIHLKMHGKLVLHASCVQIGARAVAFVGASGMGKSTLATLFGNAGYSLVSDDLLHAQLSPAAVMVHPGSTESRLRPGSHQLTDGADADTVRTTADGRLALRSRFYARGSLELAACVVPLPRRDTGEVAVSRLSPARALRRLAQFPRVVGWVEPTALAEEFQSLADLASRVPVFEALIPWGPPFAPGLPEQLIHELKCEGGEGNAAPSGRDIHTRPVGLAHLLAERR